MKKTLLTILIVILAAVFLLSGWKVLDIWMEYQEGEKTYEDLDRYISVPETIVPAETVAVQKTEPEEQEPAGEEETVPEETIPEVIIAWPEVDFAALQEINPDVVGWIYIPDTDVNYPIVQGKTNDQYLYHLITGQYNSSGSIFLESRVLPDFSMKNNPVYGHNMKNGTMFAPIRQYMSQEFFDAHPTAMLLTPDVNYLVHFFSGYVTDKRGEAWDTVFSDTGYGKWLERLVENSCFSSDVVPTSESCILTLSTCTYEKYEGRFVVHGVLEGFPVA